MGGLEKQPLNRVMCLFTSEEWNAYIEKNPDALLKDIAQHFNASISGAFYALKLEKITLKKEIFYKEGEENERKKFIEELNQLPQDADVESGVQKEMNPVSGRSKRGVKPYLETSGKRVKKDNVIAGYLNGIIVGL